MGRRSECTPTDPDLSGPPRVLERISQLTERQSGEVGWLPKLVRTCQTSYSLALLSAGIWRKLVNRRRQLVESMTSTAAGPTATSVSVLDRPKNCATANVKGGSRAILH